MHESGRAADVWRSFGAEHLVGQPALCMWSWGVDASGQGGRDGILPSANLYRVVANLLIRCMKADVRRTCGGALRQSIS